LSTGGKEVFLDEQPSDIPGRKMSILNKVALKKTPSSAGPKTNGLQSVSEEDKPAATSSSLPNNKGLAKLHNGTVVNAFIKDDHGHYIKKQVNLFYDDNENAIFWCEPGTRELENSQRISLGSITDIFLRKQTEALKSPVAAPIDAKKCMAITGIHKSIHFEASTAEEVDQILNDIMTLLQQAGRSTADAPSQDAASSSELTNPASQGGHGRRISVMSTPAVTPS